MLSCESLAKREEASAVAASHFRFSLKGPKVESAVEEVDVTADTATYTLAFGVAYAPFSAGIRCCGRCRLFHFGFFVYKE